MSLPEQVCGQSNPFPTPPALSTNRLRVIPSAQIRSEPARVFEILSSAGEIQQIDFSHVQVDQVVYVTYFDLRASRRALTELRADFKLLEADTSYDSSAARSVRIKRDSNLSLDDTMNALSIYGEIERISFSGTDQLVIEFFDTRGPIAVMTALSNSSSGVGSAASPSYSRPLVGGEARKANYSNPPPMCITSLPAAPVAALESCEYDVQIDAIRRGADRRTTLMVRNIPNKYTQKVLLRLIDLRFRDQYDFFYLPIDYKHRCNVGYAFINFGPETYREGIVEFFTLFNDKKWDKFNSEKICKISYARLQGQDALLEHFKSSSVMQQHKQLRPYFTKSGSDVNSSPPGAFGDQTGSVIESVWSETSGATSQGSAAATPTIPPLASLNLATVEGAVYSAVHAASTDTATHE